MEQKSQRGICQSHHSTGGAVENRAGFDVSIQKELTILKLPFINLFLLPPSSDPACSFCGTVSASFQSLHQRTDGVSSSHSRSVMEFHKVLDLAQSSLRCLNVNVEHVWNMCGTCAHSYADDTLLYLSLNQNSQTIWTRTWGGWEGRSQTAAQQNTRLLRDSLENATAASFRGDGASWLNRFRGASDQIRFVRTPTGRLLPKDHQDAQTVLSEPSSRSKRLDLEF